MLVVRGVVHAGGQDGDLRVLQRGAQGRERGVKPLRVVRHLAYAMRPVQSRERILDGVAAGEHVGDPGGYPQVVLEHRETVLGTHDVGAADSHVDVVGHLQAPHFHPVLRAAQHQVDGHDPVPQAPALVVHVPQEQVERRKPLLEPALDGIPLRRGEEPGHAVDGNDLFGGLVRVKDGEGDAFVQEMPVDAVLKLRQLVGLKLGQGRGQAAGRLPRASGGVEHFIIVGWVQVVLREDSSIRCSNLGHIASELFRGGADRDRTGDLLNAIQALSQLSYGPTFGNRRGCGFPRKRTA